MSYTSRFDKTSAALCFLLFAVAFVVRFYAADYGYFHGDERINEAAKVLTGQLVPGQHFYPPFINYLNAVALAGLFGVGMLADWWSSPGTFRAQYFADPTVFYVTARMVTALTGAVLAPLFFGIARVVGLDRGRSAIVALGAVLLPLGVFMAHIAKGDTGLATALVAVIWALLIRMQGNRRWDWALGLFVVLTLSFKHSAVFILAPMGVGLLGLLVVSEGAGPALRSLGRALLVVLVLWPILNIGLLMDFQNFLDYQRIQAVMSLRAGAEGSQAGLTTLLERAIEIVFGMNPAMTVGAALAPLMLWRTRGRPLRAALWVVWLSLVLGTVSVALMAGPRQPEHLWIANFAGFLLIGGLLFIELTEQPAALRRVLAAGVFSVGLMLSGYGCFVVLKQAAAQPIQAVVGDYLQMRYADRKVLTSMALTIPQQKEAQGFELARIERLARKYNVTMPEMAAERLILQSAEGAIYFVNMPGVMYGLESVDEDAIDYEVKAHAWPLQKEEWRLDYWLDQGFTVFAVLDFQTYAYESAPEIRRAFFQRIEKDCARVQAFAPTKPLFLEREVVVFDCAQPD